MSVYDKSSPVCDNCDLQCVESVAHLLFECPSYKCKREQLWYSVLDKCPPALQLELMNMNSSNRTIFVMSGMKGGYVEEWDVIFQEMLTFCFELYIMRCRQ